MAGANHAGAPPGGAQTSTTVGARLAPAALLQSTAAFQAAMKRRDPRGSPARERRPTRTAPATPNGCLLGHKRRSAATSLPCLEPLPEQPPGPSRANPTTVAIAVGKQACEFASSMLKLCMDGLKMLINLVPQWGGAWKKWSWQSGVGRGGGWDGWGSGGVVPIALTLRVYSF